VFPPRFLVTKSPLSSFFYSSSSAFLPLCVRNATILGLLPLDRGFSLTLFCELLFFFPSFLFLVHHLEGGVQVFLNAYLLGRFNRGSPWPFRFLYFPLPSLSPRRYCSSVNPLHALPLPSQYSDPLRKNLQFFFSCCLFEYT